MTNRAKLVITLLVSVAIVAITLAVVLQSPSIAHLIRSEFGGFELDPDAILQVAYAPDGKHIFCVQMYYSAFPDEEDSMLIYTTPDLKNYKEIHDSVNDFSVSPSGKYILFEGGDSLTPTTKIIDASSLEVIYQRTEKTQGVDWCLDDKHLLYMVDNNTFVRDTKTSKTRNIIYGEFLVKAGSMDGRYFFYSTPDIPDTFNVIDKKTNETKIIASIPERGYIADVMIDDSRAIVYYYIDNVPGNAAEIRSINFDGTNETLVYRRKVTGRDLSADSRAYFDGLKFNADKSALIFRVVDPPEADEAICEIFSLDTKTKKTHVINDDICGETWDYNPKTNTLLWFDDKTKQFKEQRLDL